jgi:hypothetical protein
MWSFTDPFWEAVFKWATIAAAVFGGTGIAAAFVSAWVGYQITDATQKEADRQIREARTETDRANVEIAQANERTAQLATEAAQARLEQERLKQVVSWRIFSLETIALLGDSLLAPTRVPIVLAYAAGDPESLYLAIQISSAFQRAGNWTVAAESRTYTDRLLWGLYLPGPENDNVRAIRSAFAAAHIEFSTDDVPLPPMRFGPGNVENAVVIFVGLKRPPI